MTSTRSRKSLPRALALASAPHLSLPSLASLALIASACGPSPPTSTPAQGDGGESVQIDEQSPAAFFIDPHFAGNASRLAIEEVRWGRLVDVYELQPDGQRLLRHSDFLIGQNVSSSGAIFVEEVPLLQRTNVLIRAALGTPTYTAAIEQMTAELGRVDPADVDGIGPFSMVPRNAAISVRFSDLLDSASIGPDTIRVHVGTPSEEPMPVRLLADANYGGTRKDPTGTEIFYPTRILIDPTLSEVELIEEESLGSVSGFSPNGVGYPASISATRANVVLRFPTHEDASSAQFRVLSNLAGRPLDSDDSAELVDTESMALPIVRAFRSGGETQVTGDSHNGFLRDDTPPRLLGSQRVHILDAQAAAGSDEFLIDYEFAAATCALAPRRGDLLELPGALAEVLEAGPIQGPLVAGALVRTIGFADLTRLVGTDALHVTAYDPLAAHVPACFVALRPEAEQFPLNSVSPDTQVTLRFSEPMDPVRLNGLEGLALTRTAATPRPPDIVVARIQQAPDLHTFTLVPVLPLSHTFGSAEKYFLRMDLGSQGPSDLAGNILDADLPSLQFTLDAQAPTDLNGGYVLRFHQLDEDGNGRPELRGQVLRQDGRIVPRPVARYSARADRETPIVDNMETLPHPIFPSPFDNGVTEPLSPFGSRVMTTWRYADVGLALQDEASFNIDVEGIAWLPRAGTLVADNYPDFEMRLAHAGRLPDEGANVAAAAVWTPDSGLLSDRFDSNILLDPQNTPRVVHPKSEGYFIDPVDVFTSENDDRMMPFPMNLGKPADERVTYTWRDTSILATAGEDGFGVPLGGQFNSGELADTDLIGTVAPARFVPSIGLPLLIDMKTWPNNSGGHNDFGVVLGGFPTTFGFDLPANFRVHSTGGVDLSSQVQKVDPSTALIPSGGYHDVAAIATPGTPSNAGDSLFYRGQLDLVVRISRAQTLWIDTGGASDWLAPVTVPALEHQPVGTGIDFDFRGALAVFGAPGFDAEALDAYGDQPANGGTPQTYADPSAKNFGVSFQNPGDPTWSADPAQIAGSRWVQSRITFTNNIATGHSPELRALGFAYDLAD